jgi:suppressor for copper-sensitivity B
MSLSLLGVWEIPIPGFFGSGKASDLSQREGAVGAFCKGVLTTILATPCSGPFLATALAWAVGQPPLKTYAVFLSVGIGMASPYLLIGAFPGLIRFLPKPGPWMDTFKQVMGFVLLGTVAYLLTLISWVFVVPTVAFLFGLWAACWWIGRTPLTTSFSHKARAWLSAAAFAGVVGFVTFGWLAGVMAGRFERTLETARGNSENGSAGQGEDELLWRPFSRETFEELIAAQNTVMVDFTADWCMTCKTLEKLVLNTSRTHSAVRRNGVVTLRADWTHASPEVTEMLELLGSKQVPVIAIFPAGSANHPIIFRGVYTQEMLLSALDKAGPSKMLHLTTAQARSHWK